MGEKNLVCLSLVFLAAAVAVLAGHAHGADICAKADYVPLCRSMAKGAANNPAAALKVAMEKMIVETKRAKAASAKIGKSPALLLCAENYGYNISYLQECLMLLKIKDKNTLMIRLSAVVATYGVCDDAIGESGIVTQAASLVSIDKRLTQMTSNCLHFTSLT